MLKYMRYNDDTMPGIQVLRMTEQKDLHEFESTFSLKNTKK